MGTSIQHPFKICQAYGKKKVDWNKHMCRATSRNRANYCNLASGSACDEK
uniref:Uncharacterized protein n=1 Tax=Arundo donax TaxID=35708 RepID=A0A0A9CU55_ARUDO